MHFVKNPVRSDAYRVSYIVYRTVSVPGTRTKVTESLTTEIELFTECLILDT